MARAFDEVHRRAGLRREALRLLHGRHAEVGGAGDDEHRHGDVGDADAAGAVARVGALGFVGVADDWATSVCLFHRVYGLPRPRRAQLAEPPPPGNATDDWADWAVYAAARRRFAELLDAAGA